MGMEEIKNESSLLKIDEAKVLGYFELNGIDNLLSNLKITAIKPINFRDIETIDDLLTNVSEENKDKLKRLLL